MIKKADTLSISLFFEYRTLEVMSSSSEADFEKPWLDRGFVAG